LGVKVEAAHAMLKDYSDSLTRHLLNTYEQGRHTVLVIDEAQNLSPQVLEQVRLLTNLETARHKLLRIILVGQPELQQLLARKDLRQVDQRITARYHLSPLSRLETSRYIRHRLAVAGMQDDLFTPAAMNLVYFLSQGVPRMVNTVCERSLLAIFTRGSKRVGPALVWRAFREIRGHHGGFRPGKWVLAGLFVAMVSSAVWFWLSLDMVPTAQVMPLFHEPAPGLSQINRPAVQDPSSESHTEQVFPTERLEFDGLHLPNEQMVAKDLSPQQALARVQQHYFSLWGKTLEPGDTDVCVQARAFALRCLRGVVGWEELLRLNRPVILMLRQAEAEYPLLVKAASGDRLMVDDGHAEAWVSLQEIKALWQGDFVMLWRPVLNIPLLGQGSSGEAVTWLRERLALADGEPLNQSTGEDRFDNALEARLQRFQTSNGLNADGIAGPWTMIMLNNLQLPPGTPTLETGG
jgi:general secretion pathway protein A